MMLKTVTNRRWTTTALLAVLGGGVAIAAWVGGQPYLALCLAVFYVVSGIVVYLWAGGRGDAAAVLRVAGDERQRMLDVRATATAGAATLIFCLGGTLVDLARGGTGNPWATICAVGGVSYVVAFAVLRSR